MCTYTDNFTITRPDFEKFIHFYVSFNVKYLIRRKLNEIPRICFVKSVSMCEHSSNIFSIFLESNFASKKNL